LPDLLPPIAAALTGAVWVSGLGWLGAGRHPAVARWRRLASMRGLEGSPALADRLGAGLPIPRRPEVEAHLERLLSVAGEHQTPNGWLLRVAALSASVLAILLLVEEAGLLVLHSAPAPPGLALVGAVAVAGRSYARLRARAEEVRAGLDRAVADALAQVAVTTYHHRLPATEALIVFARCQRDPSLSRLLTGDPPAHLAVDGSDMQAGSAPVYERLGAAYGVPTFSALAGALRLVTERGLPSREVFTRLARDTLHQRAVEARVAAARAKTLIVVPMGLMIIPVLVLIGAPLVAQLGALFAR
jgi:hypothetical protein